MSEPAYPLTPRNRDGEQDWPAQGHWTYEDYLRLPDDGRRYEVIRGVLYVTAAPTYDHQYVVGQAFLNVGTFVVRRRLGVVLPAPFDILLPGIASPVEPDIVFFRSGNQPQPGDKSFEGIPDLVIEVLSPKTRHIDLGAKLAAYQEAGIPEYWAIDPQLRTMVIYGLDRASRKYIEWAQGGVGDRVISKALPGFELVVEDLFPAR
ncbi:MAG TPA: Uma2 family endonuclease [Thermoanaerobaculia bacterium]